MTNRELQKALKECRRELKIQICWKEDFKGLCEVQEKLILSMTERIAAQSELLSKRAEKSDKAFALAAAEKIAKMAEHLSVLAEKQERRKV